MALRCPGCKKLLVETKYVKWHTLMNFIDFLRSEDQITEATHQTMSMNLIEFKGDIFEDQNKGEA